MPPDVAATAGEESSDTGSFESANDDLSVENLAGQVVDGLNAENASHGLASLQMAVVSDHNVTSKE